MPTLLVPVISPLKKHPNCHGGMPTERVFVRSFPSEWNSIELIGGRTRVDAYDLAPRFPKPTSGALSVSKGHLGRAGKL